MEDDWDLHAVVRGCAATSTAAAGDSQLSTTSSNQDSEFSAAWFQVQDLFEPRRERSPIEELNDLCMPYIPNSTEFSQIVAISEQSLPISQKIIKAELQQKQLPVFSGLKACPSPSPARRSKKRKNQVKKKVCHVPPEGLSSDVWSWRKYGQKPIKGSPFPRGYFKCSTLKGCLARKQVERDRSAQGMFMVTYTGKHNHPPPTHRSSLAGTTRPQPISPDNPTRASASPEKKCTSQEQLDDGEHDNDDDEFSKSNIALDDDFFVGLEDFTSNDSGRCSPDHELLLAESELSFPMMVSRTPAADADADARWLRKIAGADAFLLTHFFLLFCRRDAKPLVVRSS